MSVFSRPDAPESVAPAADVSAPVAVSTSAAAFPRVNLMPPEIAEEAKVARARLVLVGAGAVSIALVAAMLVLANGQVAAAQSELDTATAQSAVLQAQVGQYAEVPRVLAQVSAAQAELSTAMAAEVRWSYVFNDLALTIPKNVSLLTLTGTVSPTAPGAATAGGAAPASAAVAPTAGATSVLGQPGIGTVSFNGEAKSYSAVAGWLDSLAKQKTYLDPYVSTAATEQKDAQAGKPSGVTFTNTVTVSDKALSHRFDGTAGN